MPELPLNPTLLEDLETAYQRNVETGRITSSTAHDLGSAAAAAATVNRQNDAETNVNDLHLTPEQQAVVDDLREQLDTSVEAYTQLVADLSIHMDGRVDGHEIEAIFDSELAVWVANGTLDYIHEQHEQDPELTFSLVTSPNIVVPQDHIYDAAHLFAKGQEESDGKKWDSAYVYTDLYDLYSDAELSGTPLSVGGDIPDVRFTLIPSKYTTGIPITEVGKQKEALGQYKENETEGRMRPDMRLRIPSVLDGIAWWHKLRVDYEEEQATSMEAGKGLQVSSYEETYLRHIDLPVKEVQGNRLVPESYVGGDGRPYLYLSLVDAGYGVRVAVG